MRLEIFGNTFEKMRFFRRRGLERLHDVRDPRIHCSAYRGVLACPGPRFEDRFFVLFWGMQLCPDGRSGIDAAYEGT